MSKNQFKKRKPVFLYGLIYFFSLILIIVGGVFLIYRSMLYTVNPDEVTITIPDGYNSDKIGSLLEDEGVLKNDLLYKIEVIKTGLSSNFKSGRYVIPPKQKVETLIERIAAGDHLQVKSVKVTIPEGFTIEKIANRLEEKGIVSKEDFLKSAYNWNGDQWYLKGIPVDKHRLEGFLFPETYQFYQGTSSEEIIETMLRQFDKVISKYEDEIKKQNYSVQQVVTIASLVEKEAKHEEDRKKISSVIHNRLNKDMILQIDASLLYAIGHKDKITNQDLQVDSPYNTYKYKGLPPSPIANPGKSSIQAALDPEKTTYLYYVVDKKTGFHHFANTFEEHKSNIQKYYK